MEIKRLFSRKVLLAGILVFLFQAAAFVGLQTDHAGFEEMRSRNLQYNELLEEFREQPVEAYPALAEEMLAGERNAVTLCLADKLVYLEGFEGSMEEIQSNAAKLREFSIFQNKDSFSYINAIKTADDFSRMRGVRLALDRDRATERLLAYSYLSFFVFAFMAYVLYEILRERDNGMWEVTHAVKRGRQHLAAVRGISLAAVAMLFYLGCFAADLALSCLIYGTDDFGGLIQTVQAYSRYPHPVSKGGYLILFAFKGGLALAALVLLAYLLFTALRSRNLAVVVLLAGLAGEGELMKRIPVFSRWRMFRVFNVMRLFDVGAMDREYQNLNIFGNAVSSARVLLWVEILLAALGFGLAVWIYAGQYPGKAGGLERFLSPMGTMLQKLLGRLPFGLKEAYKILISRRGLLFLCAGVCAALWISRRTEIRFPEAQTDMDEVYLEQGGRDWEGFNAYVADLEAQRQSCLEQASEIQEQMRAGILGPERGPEISVLQNRAASLMIFLREFHAKQELCVRMREERGIAVYAMSDRGYGEIIGPNSRVRDLVIGVLAIALCVVFSSQVFGVEKRARTEPLLRSSRRGIGWVWRKKMVCIFCIVGLTDCLFHGGSLAGLLQKFSLPFPEAPVQSLTYFSGETAQLSVLQMLCLYMTCKAVFPFGAGAAALYVSSCRRVVNQLYVPLLIVVFCGLYGGALFVGGAPLLLAASGAMGILTALGVAGAYKNWCLHTGQAGRKERKRHEA